MRVLYAIRIPVFSLYAFSRLDRDIRQAHTDLLALEATYDARDWESLSDLDLLDELHHLVSRNSSVNHLVSSTLAAGQLSRLQKFLTARFGKDAAHHINILSSGLSHVKSTGISRDIWGLAQVAKQEGITIDRHTDPLDTHVSDNWHKYFEGEKAIESFDFRYEAVDHYFEHAAQDWRVSQLCEIKGTNAEEVGQENASNDTF